MRKKCVQLWQNLRTTLWETRFFAQPLRQRASVVGNIDVHPGFVPAIFHSQKARLSICLYPDLYRVSTGPTITTICLKNKNTNNKSRG